MFKYLLNFKISGQQLMLRTPQYVQDCGVCMQGNEIKVHFQPSKKNQESELLFKQGTLTRFCKGKH